MHLRQLELDGCGPMLVGNTIQTMASKNSIDLDGISSKLLKAVRSEIERPLAHIFNQARLYLFTKLGTHLTVTTTDLYL
jgi:hypothetical protein